MQYYKVKPEFDQKQIINRNATKTRYHYKPIMLIAHELYTLGELERLQKTCAINWNWFDEVQIPRTKIYWFFGARFEAKEN